MIWLLLIPTALALAVICRHVFALADTLTVAAPAEEADPGSGDGSIGPNPLDDLPPDHIDWDDFNLRLELFAVTIKEPA